MTMKRVLVLGGTGFVGRELVEQLVKTGWAVPVVASRAAASGGAVETIALDTRDIAGLQRAMANVHAVVNCVAGDGLAIGDGAKCLVQAARAAGQPRLVHMSTMSVYGRAEGIVNERHPMQDDIGWYGHAKIDAEKHIQAYASAGGEAVILRPGCVVGPQSTLWVQRVGTLLQSGRLGDLGAGGDGPANLVDVADVAQAAVRSLQLELPPGQAPAFNLACPDSPRWNGYFTDLAMAIGATPLRTLGARRMKLDAYALGIPIKILERLFSKLKRDSQSLPAAIPPSLLGLWRQQITLDSRAATFELGVEWTPYKTSLEVSSRWFLGK